MLGGGVGAVVEHGFRARRAIGQHIRLVDHCESVVPTVVIRDHDVEPTIQYFLSVPVKNSLSTAFKVGTGTGTLKFTTSVSGPGPISIRVPIKITQRD